MANRGTAKAKRELMKRAGLDKKENPFKKLHYSTDHLPFYHEFSNTISLFGRHYIPIIKARLYQLYGGILQKPIKLGQLFTDTRIHVAYPIVTEGGKNEIIYSIKALIERGIDKGGGVLFTMTEPLSYHPEALVGKRVERTIDNPDYLSGVVKSPKVKRVRIDNRGHFDCDFLDFDECTQLIISDKPDDQQAREYLSKSENPIGRNKVEKRLVEDLPDEKIAYFPNCTNSYFFQPHKKIPEDFVLQGFGRRKLIPLGNINLFLDFADESLYTKKLENTNFSIDEYQNRIINHLELMRKTLNKKDFLFTEKAKELIKDYALYLSAQGKIHSEKIANYCKLTKFTALSNLIKMSCIIAGSYYKNDVCENCVSLAFMDLVELNQNTFDFIDNQIYGLFDYGTGWGGANYEQKECLQVLYDKKAFNRETSEVTIEEFVEEIVADVFNVKSTQARNRYLEMKRLGLIGSDQVGKTKTVVWLKISPEEHKNYIEGDKGYKGFSVYNSVFLTKNDIVPLVKPCNPCNP